MGAVLAIRSQRAFVVLLALLLIIVSLIINHQTSSTPLTDHIRVPNINLPEYLKPKKQPTQDVPPPTPPTASQLDRVTAAASNSTLGFSRILAIHMKHRWDKWDAAMIQSYTSGLDLTYYPAVDGKADIEDAGRLGLPPQGGRVLGAGAIACWRSHANVWADLVQSRGPPVMIFESDAAWDVNLRGIMGLANKHLLAYLTSTNSQPTNAAFHLRAGNPRPETRGVEYNPDDPWQSEHWDVLTLGHCGDAGSFHDEKIHPRTSYRDPFAVPALGGLLTNRWLARSKGWPCTTAYAVSHRGAAKLLLRHAIDLNEPIDLVMLEMINKGELISYAISPAPVVQWEYHANIGMKAGASSDLFRIDNVEEDSASVEGDDGSGWEEVRRTKSVWVWEEKFGKGFRFLRPALGGTWDVVFGRGAQFVMPEVPGAGKVGEAEEERKEGAEEVEVKAAENGTESQSEVKPAIRRRYDREPQG